MAKATTKTASSDKWQQTAREILDRTDIRAVYAALGVDVTGQEPNSNGWVECRAHGVEDRSPSAGINVSGAHPHRGRYKEFVGNGLNLSLFEFAAHCGKFPNWTDARNHYAELAGVKLPGTKPPRHPTDALEFRDYNTALAMSWCMKKPGISEEAVRLCGGRIATESKKFTVVTLPVYGEHLLDDDPCGWVSWNITGRPLEIWQGKGLPPKSVKMKTASGSRAGWMGSHGLSVLERSLVVWVTEGPSDMLGLVSAITEQAPALISLGKVAVICNSAGATERPQLDFIAHLAGKTVIVVPDCDQPGQTGCRRRAEAIAEVATSVRFVRLPFEITENHGKDLRDYLTDEHTFEDLQKLAEVAEIIRAKPAAQSIADKPEPSQSNSSSEEESEKGATPPTPTHTNTNGKPAGDPAITFSEIQMLEAIGLDVLGEMDGGKIQVFSSFHHKTDVIQDIGKLSYQRLMQIAGPPVKSKVLQGDSEATGFYLFSQVKEAIGLMAGYRRINDNISGVGCWQGIDEDGGPSAAIVLVGAGEAAVRNGSPGLKKINKPRYGGRLIDISQPTAWYQFDELNSLVQECDQDFAAAAVTDAENLFARWKWVHQGQTPKILAGLVIATWVQTLWTWRPQVSIVGQSNSGKTFLFKALEGIFGPLAITSSGSTAAGVRQAISKSASIALLDEFESGRHRAETLEMIRASSRGDRVLRGTTGHKGQEFILRHIVWTAGIESGLRREPDKNRFIRLALIKPIDRDMGKLNLPADDELRIIGQRLLAVALCHVMQARETASLLRSLRFDGIDSRLVEGYAVPAACYAAAMGEQTVGPASEVLQRMLATAEAADESSGDAMQLLQDILETEVDFERGAKFTVAQLIRLRKIEPTKAEELGRKGIGIVGDGYDGEEVFFVSHRATCRYLLRGTQWAEQNIDEILIRLDGAKKCKKRLAGKLPWGISIPLLILAKLGLSDD